MEPIFSIIIPTKSESKNILALLTEIDRTVKGVPFDIIFVDDSSDDTPQVINRLKSQFTFPISVIERPLEARQDGLFGAVITGIKASTSEWICVMDGDLQHPPALIPVMVDHIRTPQIDLIIGSRSITGEGTKLMGRGRSLATNLLTLLIRILFPLGLKKVSDPLSGFFMIRRRAVDVDKLHALGFKILLAILVKNPELKFIEVPYQIRPRHDGRSKADWKIGFQFLSQLAELRLPGYWRMFKFLAVGASGFVVNNLVLFILTDYGGINYLASAVISTQSSTLWNFMLSDKWVFSDRLVRKPGSAGNKSFRSRLISFFVLNNLFLLVRGPILVFLTSGLGIHYLLSNIISLVLMTAARFFIADLWIWGTPSRSSPKRYFYDIHGILKMESSVKLPELAYFRKNEGFDWDQVDIKVELGTLPDEPEQTNHIIYREILGDEGFGISILEGNPMVITATPLLRRSPHVLYTNVIEPVLRWHLVRRGYALAHSACLNFNGNALIITAKTDTGKTTTILEALNNYRCAFLSDDMTILSPDGMAINYPKPLTISKHTLQVAVRSALGRKEKAFLQIQGRLHSRSGRRFGLLLSRLRLPASTINALFQMIVPPPKYSIQQLIPEVQLVKSSPLSRLVIIERGVADKIDLGMDQAVEILIKNCEDAYGFPPYPELADQLCNWNGTDLHIKEREIITSALSNCTAVRLRSSSYDWWRDLVDHGNGSRLRS